MSVPTGHIQSSTSIQTEDRRYMYIHIVYCIRLNAATFIFSRQLEGAAFI